MKILLPILLLCAFNVHANLGATVVDNTISWPDTGGWMQVQDSADYQVPNGCEGFITSCVVEPGSYKIIDHSNDIRQRGVVVAEPISIDAPLHGEIDQESQTLSFTFKSETCFRDSVVAGVVSDRVGTAECVVGCPADLSIVGVTSCTAYIIDGESLPTSFYREVAIVHGTGRAEWAGCKAHPNSSTYNGERMLIKIEVFCMNRNLF